MEPVQYVQVNLLTTAKDVAAQLDSPKLELHANKPARTTNLLMTMEFVTDAQSTRSSQTEDALVSTISSETTVLEFASFHAPLLNSDTKEDALNAHSIFNTELKSKDVPVLMDFTSTITEFVKKFQLSQSLVMQAFSSTVQKAALPAQLDADHAQALPFVLLAYKMDSMLSMVSAELSVVMD